MKKISLLVTAIAVTGCLYAQKSPTDFPEIVPPPPSVASLMRFEEVPVDYYTGQVNIGLPLGNVPIHKDLAYPISMRYNTQAIRVNERSGWLGTGFAMSTGGTISRTIKGLPDELNDPYKGKGIYHNDYYDFDILNAEKEQEFLWNSANGKHGDRWDADQDLYQYSYLGGSGRFIVVKEYGGLKAVITESETNEKINLTYNTGTFEITGFEIIDSKGYQYIFDVHNENAILSWTHSTSQSGTSSGVSGDYMGANNVPNAWYLKKILLPNNEELCHFDYQDVSESYDTPSSSTRYNLTNQGVYNYGPTLQIKGYNNSLLMPRFTSFSQSITSTQKYVDVVTFRDGTTVKYNLILGHPEYFASGAKLSSIEIKYPSGLLHKQINFSYETTNNNRLFLTEVKEIFGSDDLKYTIAYHNKDELPGFGDDHKDAWGYYNGPNANNQLSVISQADPEKATTGAIASITYPTGGKKEFVFESNSYGYQGAQQVDPKTIPQNRIVQNRAGSFSIDLYTQVSINRSLLYIDVSQKININSSITSSGIGANQSKHRIRFHEASPKSGVTIVTPSGPVNYLNYDINDFQYTTNNNAKEFALVNNNTVSSLTSGWYFIELITPQTALHPDPTYINVNLSVQHSAFQLTTVNMKGGGIRIRDVLFTDAGTVKRKISYVYQDNPYLNLGTPQDLISSGSFEVNPNSRTYIKGKDHPFVTLIQCWGGSLIGDWGTVHRAPVHVDYLVTRDISSTYTPNTKGNYVGYKYVLAKETGSGSELMTYVSPREVQIQTGGFSKYPFKPQENLDYKRGVLSNKAVFDESQQILLEETYDYHDVSSIAAVSLFTFEAQGYDCPWDQFYDFFTHYKNGPAWATKIYEPCGVGVTDDVDVSSCYAIDPDVQSDTYAHIKGVLLPKEVHRKQYFYNGTTLSHTVASTDKMWYNTKNKLREKITELEEAGALVVLKQKIRYPYDAPIAEYTTAERAIFDLMVTQNIISNPVYQESFRNSDLLSKNKIVYSQFSTLNFQPSNILLYKASQTEASEIAFVDYDKWGNLLEVKKRDGTPIVYIWGYHESVPIAKIENATYAQVSSQVSNLETLSDSDFDRTVDVKNSMGVITNYLGTEGNLREALENLRNSLPDALVTTFSYDPLIGVTSITDPRGETTSFQYDNLHRPGIVKDAYGHIVSAYQYNYKN